MNVRQVYLQVTRRNFNRAAELLREDPSGQLATEFLEGLTAKGLPLEVADITFRIADDIAFDTYGNFEHAKWKFLHQDCQMPNRINFKFENSLQWSGKLAFEESV